jgi:MFS family permease
VPSTDSDNKARADGELAWPAAVSEGPDSSRLRRALRAVAVDAGLLRRRREFRLLVAGQVTSELGSMVTFVALPYQCFQLTRSTVAVGLLGASEFVPILLLALLGGALADAFDRRRLIQLAEAAALVVCAGLVANSLLPDPHVWVLYAASALMAACTALRRPPLDALVPRLVQRDELKAAAALHWSLADTAALLGPALAGLLIVASGLAATYAVDGATFIASLASLAVIRTPPPPADARPPSFRGIVEGVRYASRRPELIGTYVIDVNAMFFGMPMALFPALAQRYGGAEVVGLMYAAPSAGSVLATITSGWARRVHRHGRAITFAAAGWGLAIVGFGLAGRLWLALVFLAVAGGMDAISGLFRGVMWNETIPDALRGRLAGLEMLSWSTGPTLGNVEAGAAAALVGLRASVVLGGVLCAGGSAAIAGALPAFWRYDARTFVMDKPPPAERVTAAPR